MSNDEIRDKILQSIADNGPMCSRDFNEHRTPEISANSKRPSNTAWARPPHKHALDYLWLAGDLSVSYRKNFTKYYDLTERVIPATVRSQVISTEDQIDWLCRSALEKLGFATATEIQRFWEACDLDEVQVWLKNQEDVIELSYQDAEGKSISAYAMDSIEECLDALPEPTNRVRVLSPFDPVTRDRSRLNRLFGFNYKIEIYTPKNQRKYGYYVYPILEASRFIGRIEVRADKNSDKLETQAWWLEPRFKDTAGRRKKLISELHRLARLANVKDVAELPPLSKLAD